MSGPSFGHQLTPKHLSARIANGKQAQDLLDELVAMVETYPATSSLTDIIPALKVLLANNARLATEAPGCAYERLMKQPWLVRTLSFSPFMDSLLLVPGEIPLHIIARDCPRLLASNTSNVILRNIRSALRTPDANGRTVAHWLWSQDSLLVEQATMALDGFHGDASPLKPLQDEWMDTLRVLWQIQSLLQDEIGIPMDQPDNEGITAMDLCLARIEDGSAVFLPSFPLCEQVLAHHDARKMMQATPKVHAHIPNPRF